MTTDGEKDSNTEVPKRGFAAMEENKRRQIASRGGKSVPPEHRKFSTDPQLARHAGCKGGHNVPADERSFSKNRQLASEAGRKGGEASARRKHSL
jgi:general stress protein YciG